MAEPVGRHCPYDDPGAPGYRGGHRCRRCDGSGSVFWVDGRTYPNTMIGYRNALAALRAVEVAELPSNENVREAP